MKKSGGRSTPTSYDKEDHKPLTPENQVKYLNLHIPVEDQIKYLNSNSIHQFPRDNFEYFIKWLNPTDLKVLEYIVRKSVHCHYQYPKQETIAKQIRRSREETNKSMRKLVKYGVINAIQRCNHSNIYKLSAYFSNSKVRERWSKYIYAFKYIVAIASLIISSQALTTYQEKQHNKEKAKVLIATLTKELRLRDIYNKSSRNNEEMSVNVNTNRDFSTGKTEEPVKTTGRTTPEERPNDLSYLNDFLQKMIPEDELKAIKEKQLRGEPLLPSRQSDPRKPTTPFTPNKKPAKGMVYDSPIDKPRILTESDIHLLKYGSRSTKKERPCNDKEKPKNAWRIKQCLQ